MVASRSLGKFPKQMMMHYIIDLANTIDRDVSLTASEPIMGD